MILLNNYIKNLKNCMPFDDCYVSGSDITLVIKSKYIPIFIKFLKNHESCRFDLLIDICAVDYPENIQRFEIIYQFLSITYNQRLTLKTYTTEYKSIYSIYYFGFFNSSWCEREIWDMFGVWFYSHPDLRKILTDYGFDKHPLRKDFPVNGFYELIYSDFQKSVIKTKIEFSQEFRLYKLNRN